MVTNGKIALNQLDRVPGTLLYLSPGCLSAWTDFCNYVQLHTGIRPRITAPDGAYRSYARQVYWRNIFYRYGRPIAARPGTSNHGLGVAIDIANYTSFNHAWLVGAAKRFGFRFDPTEQWHINFIGSPHYKSLTPIATSKRKGSKDMILLYGPDTGTAAKPGPKIFVVASKGVWDRYSASFSKQLGSQFGSAIQLSLASMLDKKTQYLG